MGESHHTHPRVKRSCKIVQSERGMLREIEREVDIMYITSFEAKHPNNKLVVYPSDTQNIDSTPPLLFHSPCSNPSILRSRITHDHRLPMTTASFLPHSTTARHDAQLTRLIFPLQPTSQIKPITIHSMKLVSDHNPQFIKGTQSWMGLGA